MAARTRTTWTTRATTGRATGWVRRSLATSIAWASGRKVRGSLSIRVRDAARRIWRPPAAPGSSTVSRCTDLGRSDVGPAEVVAYEEQCVVSGHGARVGETIAEVQRGVVAPAAEAPERLGRSAPFNLAKQHDSHQI